MKKHKMTTMAKRMLAASLAGVMVAAPLTGCGAGGGKKGEPTTLTVYSQRANYAGEQRGWSAKVLEDELNLKINIVNNSGGAFNTRMESGDLGDVIVFGSEGDFLQAMQAGLLYDWEEDDLLADYGTYIQDNMPYALEKVRDMSTDGKIYGLGYNVASNSNDIQSFFYTWDLRWDLYKELGYPEVKDLDDLLEVFKGMKEICPTDDAGKPTYAVSLWPDWDGDMVMYVKSTATAFYGWDEFGVGLYNPVDGSFHGALDEGSPYLEMLDFFHELYKNNLLDPDSMTATYDTSNEKVRNGGTFWSIFDYAGSLAYNTDEHVSQGKMMRSLTPTEASPIVYGLSVLGSNSYWAIGSKCQHPEEAMELINYLATPTGRLTMEYGPKGVTWDYDEDGNTYFTEFGKMAINDKAGTQMEGDYAGGSYKDGECQINCITWTLDATNPESNGEHYNKESWKSNQLPAQYEIDQDWRDYTGCNTTNEYMSSGNYVVSPGSAYVAGEKSDELKTTWTQVTGCITEYTWKAIYAESDSEYEELVAEMIEKANAYGYQECWDWTNAEAAKRKAAEEAVGAID